MIKEFYKYHGAGNDFIMIDNMNGRVSVSAEYVARLCDRHFGVGADGLILLEASDKADCFMNYFNSDGTMAEMCGNGVRCTAKFFLEQTKSSKKEMSIDTRAGIKKIICNEDGLPAQAGSFSVNMGAPVFSHKDFPDGSLELENISFSFVSMGNPHAVGFVADVNQVNLLNIGPRIENDSHFPNKINVELVQKISDDYFKVKVWERGSGATLACGTGACAVYAILKKENKNLEEATLEFPGGKLFLSENEKGEVILCGPAECVFKGEMK